MGQELLVHPERTKKEMHKKMQHKQSDRGEEIQKGHAYKSFEYVSVFV